MSVGTVLVWTGDGTPPSPCCSRGSPRPRSAPLTYTPSYLAEKIYLRSALEGERKHVTVLFADLKESTELIRGLDPEAASSSSTPRCTT